MQTWALLRAESSSVHLQNIAAWFALVLPSGISADGKQFLACPHAAPCSAEAVSHTQPLVILNFSSSFRAGVNVSKSLAHPCLCLGTQSRDLGTTAREYFAYIVFTRC